MAKTPQGSKKERHQLAANIPAWAKKLAGVRAMYGMSQSAFADSIGVSKNAYQWYEKGERDPSIATLQRLHEKYGVSLDLLLIDEIPSSPNAASSSKKTSAARRYLSTISKASEYAEGDSGHETQPLTQRKARPRALPKPE